MNTNSKTVPTIELETIVDGNFATSGQKNFNAYSESKTRYFVNKATMEKLGVTTDEEFASKSPLYALVTTKTWNARVSQDDVVNGVTNAEGVKYTADDVDKTIKTELVDGKVQMITFDRQEASAIFTDVDSAVDAFTAKKLMNIKVQEKISLASLQSKVTLDNFAKENELTPEKLQVLASLSLG